MQVDARYEKFLLQLANPLQLNEMRTMKEDKYVDLRELLDKFMGSPILRIMKDHQEELELDPEIFDLVYQGFWDLYTFHPQLRDVSARKLQGWIQKVKLNSGPDRMEDAEEEDEPEGDDNEENKEEGDAAAKPKKEVDFMAGEDAFDPLSAVVRIKIPKVPKEPEMDDEGNEIEVEVNESDLEDIPFEDKCLQCVSKLDGQQIWVINHLAGKTVRQDISAELRQFVERLDNLDTQDFNFRMEKEATAFEEALLKLMEDTPEKAHLKTPKVPVFDFRPKY